MEQAHCPTSENVQLGRLVADAVVEIERLGYGRRSRNRYRAIWKHLIEFSHQKNLGNEFSADLAARFLEEYRVRDKQVDGPGDGRHRHVAFSVKVLAEFAKTGRIQRAVTEVQAIHLVPTMQHTLRDYEQYCKDRLHLRPSTLHRCTTELTILLDFHHKITGVRLNQVSVVSCSTTNRATSARAILPPLTPARSVTALTLPRAGSLVSMADDPIE